MRLPRAAAGRKFLISAALVVPCFWQSRIQASDLASHTYNAWLAELIGKGQAPGLTIEPVWTNVLFDWMLSLAIGAFGYGMGPKVAVAACVLIFYWGAFQWAGKLSGARPFYLAPILAMLAYGWVFHMGFFNFYLSMGICLWAMYFGMQVSAGVRAAGLLLVIPAILAHALPVFWAVGMTGYWVLAAHLRPRRRPILLGACVGAVVSARLWIAWRFDFFWSIEQLIATSGADQVWVFGLYYLGFSAGLLFLFGLAGLQLLDAKPLERIVLGVPSQLVILNAAIVFLIPTTIHLPSYQFPLSFITTRMSLAVGLCMLALLGPARPGRFLSINAVVLAAAYFAAIYRSTSELNLMEDQLGAALRTIPVNARVVAIHGRDPARVYARLHLIDRVCIGHCYSYANYEASTLQFRVRAQPGNPIVTANSVDSAALQQGDYTVKLGDEPLHVLTPCGESGQFCASIRRAGQKLR